MEHLDSENVLAIVRTSNETSFWLDNELQVSPEWKAPGIVDGCIVIRLQDTPRTSAGVVFGTGEDCEVVITELEDSVSRQGTSLPNTFERVHFSIGLNHEYRLVARDLTGGQGIRVIYNGSENNPGDLRYAEWILAGPDVPDLYQQLPSSPGELDRPRLMIVVKDEKTFEVFPGKALQGLRARAMQAQLFRQGNDPNGLLSQLVPVTVPRCSDSDDKILIEKVIGGGGFGIAIHRWNPHTGEQHVVKRPKSPLDESSRERWKQEVRFMDLLRHPHIVEFMGANFDATPFITMEYVALGSLRKLKDVTRIEAMIILRQCTSALSFLHDHEPAIIHRDVKPENILVQQRARGGAHGDMIVKLCDFGLAREIPRGTINDRVGSRPYEPPEHYPRGGLKLPLGVKMDVWCMGLVTFELVSRIRPVLSLRSLRGVGGNPMHDRIVEDLNRFAKDDNQGDFRILKQMLVLDPEDRISAKAAHGWAEGMALSAFEQAQTPPTEPGAAVQGQDQPLVDQDQPLVDQVDLLASDEMSSLSLRPTKRKRQ
ncbi:unnamed protein product [Clonostachys solani]|uniref:non-specific serine/threonine protein kinase n=1 Tax=Clonostachys solani TaxID=160281 RepID=A0A9N9ZEB0_9HYPO|nr:unnamed protein product [Clonostachys solani]